MKMRRWISLLAAVGILLSLSGCGSASIAQRRGDTSSTLYVGVVGTSFPTSFMPWLSRDGIAPTVASMVYNTLFSYNSRTAEYDPLIAKRWCYVDLEGNPLTKDGTTATANDYAAIEGYYTENPEDYAVVRVELFDNVRWSDGEKLTVEDVYYSFDVATDYPLSNHAGALAWTADLRHESSEGQPVVQGMFTAEHPDYSGTFGIQPGEEDTVMYLVVNKTFDAVTTLFSTILILPRHIWKDMVSPTQQLNNKDPQGDFLVQYQNPVGSGPWLLNREQTNTQMIVLDRNPDYHLTAEDGSPLYKVERIKLMLYLDSNTAIFALRKGYIDILDSPVSSNFLSLLEQEENIAVSRAAGTSVTALTLNVNPPEGSRRSARTLLTDPAFRRALALAIDQEELIDKTLDGHGSTASAGLILREDSLLYEPSSDLLSAPYDQRLAEANKILDGICPEKDGDGYRLYEGKRISFEVLTNPGGQDLVAYLERQFQKIGVALQYKAQGSTPEATYLYSGDFDMTVQAVILSMFNAGVMYKSHFVTTERSSNYGKLSVPELTETVEQMRSSLNQDAKIGMIHDLQVLVAQQYYKLPLYTTQVLSAARTDRFTGYREVPGSTFFNAQTLKNLVQVREGGA